MAACNSPTTKTEESIIAKGVPEFHEFTVFLFENDKSEQVREILSGYEGELVYAQSHKQTGTPAWSLTFPVKSRQFVAYRAEVTTLRLKIEKSLSPTGLYVEDSIAVYSR